MPSNSLLTQPDISLMSDPDAVYRHLMEMIGRDLGLDEWGSNKNHTSYESDTEYAHTLLNNGTGGHLNIPGELQVKSDGTGTFVTTLNVTTLTVATLNVTTLLNSTGNSVLGNANSDTNTFVGVSTFRNAAASAVQAFIDAGNNRVIIGSNTALGSDTTPNLQVVGRLYVAPESANDLAIQVRRSSAATVGWNLGMTSDSDFVFKDDAGVEKFRVGDSASTYQAVVTGKMNVTDKTSVSQLVAGATTFSGTEELRVVGETRLEGTVLVTSGLTVQGTGQFDGAVTLGNAAGDSIAITGNATFDNSSTFTGTATFNGQAAFNDPVTVTDFLNVTGTEINLTTTLIDFDAGSAAGFIEDTWSGHIQAKHDGATIYIPYLSSAP